MKKGNFFRRISMKASMLLAALISCIVFLIPSPVYAWSWYKPWTWPLGDAIAEIYEDIAPWVSIEDGCKPDYELMATVSVEGEDEALPFYSQTAIAWNYAVAKALEGKKVKVTLMANWNAKTERMRTQYRSPTPGGDTKDREWYCLRKYYMGDNMRKIDIPYLDSSSTDKIDCFQDGDILLPGGCDITVDLNGCIINKKESGEYVEDGEIFFVAPKATLTVIDSNPKEKHDNGLKGGCIIGGSSNNGAGAIYIKDGAKVYIEGGTFYDNTSASDGGAIYADGSDAELYIDGTLFKNNAADHANIERNFGGAIAVYKSKAEILNCRFEKNRADNRGGALFCKDGNLKVTGCAFDGNEVKNDYGGALYLDNSSGGWRMRLSNITCTNNSTGKDGGAIYANTDGMCDIVDAVVSKNNAGRNGGGIYVNQTGLCLMNIEVKSNKATEFGGGIYLDSMEDLNVAGVVAVKSNKSGDGDKSNICLQDGNFTTGFIYSGGLLPGSYLGIYSTKESPGPDGLFAIKNISEYEYKQYVHRDRLYQKMRFDVTETRTASYMASLIGDNKVVLTASIVVAGILIVAALIIWRKRKIE